MPERAGSMDASKPDWRGLIRHDGYPWYVCYHRDHETRGAAQECARNARAWMKDNPNRLPEGWITYATFREMR